jgi:hypothetical protein
MRFSEGPSDPGAIAALCPAGPAAGTGPARPWGGDAAGPARNARSLGRNRSRVWPSCRSRTAIWWRSARISTTCPGRSPEEAAVTRTRSSRSDRPVEAAQPIIMPRRAGPREGSPLIRHRNQTATPTWADEIFGTGTAEVNPRRRAGPRPASHLLYEGGSGGS